MTVPGVSFYYDLMLSQMYRYNSDPTHKHVPELAILPVMYERGRMRYEMLLHHGLPWSDFRCDARSNRDLCIEYLFLSYGKRETKRFIELAIAMDSELAEEIDERNSKK